MPTAEFGSRALSSDTDVKEKKRMIKPVGSDTLQPLFVYDPDKHHELMHEAESLPSVVISSQAAGNAVMMGAGYFSPLSGYMNVADAMGAAEKMTLSDGSFFPVPVMCLIESADALGGAKRIALRDPNVEGNPVLAVMDLRKRHQEEFTAKHGIKLGLMSFFVKACCDALRKFPVVNASIEGDELVYHNYQDIGIAVSTERGLMVPIIRNAENLGQIGRASCRERV